MKTENKVILAGAAIAAVLLYRSRKAAAAVKAPVVKDAPHATYVAPKPIVSSVTVVESPYVEAGGRCFADGEVVPLELCRDFGASALAAGEQAGQALLGGIKDAWSAGFGFFSGAGGA